MFHVVNNMIFNRKRISTDIALSDNGHLPVLVTVCDDSYFKFAHALIMSAEVFSPGMEILVHLVNPSQKTLAKVGQVKEKLTNTKLSFSYEMTTIIGATIEQLKTYYASARFLLIHELLPTCSRDFFFVDADSLIVNPVDNDFTDKIEADICLIRRDIKGEKRANLKVATGSIYVRNRPASKEFFSLLSKTLLERIEKLDLSWFTDQVIFAEQLESTNIAAVRNIKTKYADWNFSASSILWAGKGQSKNTNLKFLTIQKVLSERVVSQGTSLSLIYKLLGKKDFESTDIFEKIKPIIAGIKPRAVIYLPRLDLPWKQFNSEKPPLLSNDTLALRIEWKKLGLFLSNALEREGFFVETDEIPAWEITEERINFSSANLAFIPHRSHLDFDISKVDIPIYFYMQEYFSWMFTIDSKGWSAAASIYPIKYSSIPETNKDFYSDYLNKLESGQLASKFSQVNSVNTQILVESGQIPRHSDPRVAYKRFIFFPLQVPHDQSIQYFSKLSEEDIITNLLKWSKRNDVPVVFKPHPANPKSMGPLLKLIQSYGGYIADANIHDLIELSSAVYTINSGVGFEALLHNKPIVTFGRAEYDCCTFKANPKNLDIAWIYCILSSRNDLKKGYAKFFNWFTAEYAYDLTDYEQTTMRLRLLAKRIKKRHFSTEESV